MSLGPVLQTKWDIRAVGNWVGGGTGTGIMVAAAVLSLSGIGNYSMAFLASVFITAGLLSVSLEIGRPLRALNVFRNPFTSWMSREAWVGAILIPSGVAAFWLQSQALILFAAVAALGYLYCQAYILKDCRGITAWRIDEIVPLIMTTGLTEGAAVVLVLSVFIPSLQGLLTAPAVTLTVLVLLIGRFITWRRYHNALIGNAPIHTAAIVKQVGKPYLIYGNLLPVLLLAIAILLPDFAVIPMLAAGIVTLLSGWILKLVIVTRAGYDQGYAMPHSPARGAGKPGPGIQPGWPEKT